MNYARWTNLVGSLAAMALLAAACGGSSISSERTEEVDAAASVTGESETTAVADTDGAGRASVSSECQDRQLATGGQYEIKNIPAADPDGGLVARFAPGSASDRIDTDALPEGTIVDTSTDDGDCFVTSDGATWWNIGTPLLATGGWVNARFLVLAERDAESGEESDAHADCVVLPDLADECFPVFYVGNDITALDFEMTDAVSGEFQHACAYQDFTAACEVLAFVGPGDGIGNGLSQTPDAAIKADCATMTGVSKKLACAEFESRK